MSDEPTTMYRVDEMPPPQGDVVWIHRPGMPKPLTARLDDYTWWTTPACDMAALPIGISTVTHWAPLRAPEPPPEPDPDPDPVDQVSGPASDFFPHTKVVRVDDMRQLLLCVEDMLRDESKEWDTFMAQLATLLGHDEINGEGDDTPSKVALDAIRDTLDRRVEWLQALSPNATSEERALIGRYVNITWTNDHGAGQGMAGVLIGITPDREDRWALLDWGMAAPTRAKNFAMATTDRA